MFSPSEKNAGHRVDGIPQSSVFLPPQKTAGDGFSSHCIPIIFPVLYGSVSKPCTPGEHQNSW